MFARITSNTVASRAILSTPPLEKCTLQRESWPLRCKFILLLASSLFHSSPLPLCYLGYWSETCLQFQTIFLWENKTKNEKLENWLNKRNSDEVRSETFVPYSVYWKIRKIILEVLNIAMCYKQFKKKSERKPSPIKRVQKHHIKVHKTDTPPAHTSPANKWNKKRRWRSMWAGILSQNWYIEIWIKRMGAFMKNMKTSRKEGERERTMDRWL